MLSNVLWIRGLRRGTRRARTSPSTGFIFFLYLSVLCHTVVPTATNKSHLTVHIRWSTHNQWPFYASKQQAPQVKHLGNLLVACLSDLLVVLYKKTPKLYYYSVWCLYKKQCIYPTTSSNMIHKTPHTTHNTCTTHFHREEQTCSFRY